MRPIAWVDKRGYKRLSLVKNTDGEDAAPRGLPCGVPDLDQVDWEDMKKEINNALHDACLFTERDLHKSTAGLNIAAAILKRRLTMLYRENSPGYTRDQS